MSQGIQQWPLFEGPSIPVNYNATHEHSIPVSCFDQAVISPELQGQTASLQEMHYLTGTVESAYMITSQARKSLTPMSQSFAFDRDEFLQADGADLSSLFVSPNEALGAPTTDYQTYSAVESSAASGGPPIINIEPAGDKLKAVGSPQIQQAASKRRKKGGNRTYPCLFRDHGKGCSSTFTALHNLRYHVNSHLDIRPYKCKKYKNCRYAATSPATLKRHQATCKGTGHRATLDP